MGVTGRHSAPATQLRLPRFRRALTTRRRVAGLTIALLGIPLLLWILDRGHAPESITIEVLSFQLLVVVVAIVGGLWPALLAAVFSALALDIFFIEPHLTVAVADPVHLIALFLNIVIASLVSVVVGRAARQTQRAQRAAAESELLQSVAGSVLRGRTAVQALVDRAYEAFSLTGVRLLDDGDVLAVAGEPGTADLCMNVTVAPGLELELYGPPVPGSEQRLLNVITAQLAASMEHRKLEETAREIEPLAASDRARAALLSALSHDLRRPLASATAAVSGLRSAGDTLSHTDKRELLSTAEESLSSLTALVTDLLDVSRLEAGVLTISVTPCDPMDVIAPAMDELDLNTDGVETDLGHGGALVVADPVLLQRALVNLLANAVRHSPPNRPVRIVTSVLLDQLEIRVVDHGPGIPTDRRDEVFVPFQRLGDTDNSSGLGLGLALSRGFVEVMHGTLEPRDTPEGGLTMVISLPAYRAQPRRPVPSVDDTEPTATRVTSEHTGGGAQ